MAVQPQGTAVDLVEPHQQVDQRGPVSYTHLDVYKRQGEQGLPERGVPDEGRRRPRGRRC